MLKTVGTSESKSSLPTPGTKPLSSGDVTLDRLHNIYTKILQGKDLSSSDQTFLDTTSKQTDWMVVRAYSYMFGAEDDSSVEKINSLSSRVLSSGISGTDLVKNIENFFEGRTAVTVREAASFATLISACSQKEPSFSKALDQFAAKSKKPPFRDQLIPLVAKYNKEAIPKPSLVGNVVAKVRISVEQHEVERELTVRYNAKGFLEIIDGPVAPMDISFDTTLSSSKVSEISTLYTSLASQTNFNNLAMVLEFAQFAHQAQIKDPTLTLDQALKQFTPDTVATFDKYQSGTCGVLAKKFSDEVEKRFGVPAQRVGTVTENDWNAVPLPGTEDARINMLGLRHAVHGIDHTDVVIPFKTEDGAENVLKFACSFSGNAKGEIEHYKGSKRTSSLDQFFAMKYSRDFLPDRVLDDAAITKGALKGRFKGVIRKGDKMLGVDFLRGNFYINNSWAKTLKGLPLNQDGRVSIDLKDLAKPGEIGTYTVDGVETSMPHGEALEMILSAASKEMTIPKDMAVNLVLTAQMAPRMGKELYFEPLPFIQEHYSDLQLIGKVMNSIKPDLDKEQSAEDKAKFEKMHPLFMELETHIGVEFNPEEAVKVIEQLKALI